MHGRMKILCVALLSVAVVACGNKGPRLVAADESIAIGDDPGIVIFKQLVGTATDKLLQSYVEARFDGGRPLISFVGLENKSNWKISADAMQATEIQIETSVLNSGRFGMIGSTVTQMGMNAAGATGKVGLMTQQSRDAFAAALGREGQAPDYFIWGDYSRLPTKAGGERVYEFSLTIELVNVRNGQTMARQQATQMAAYYD